MADPAAPADADGADGDLVRVSAASGRRFRSHRVLYPAAMLAATGVAIWITIHLVGDVSRSITAMAGFHAGWLGVAGAVEVAGLAFAGEALWRLQGRPTVIGRTAAQAASLVNLSLGAIMPAAPVEGFTLSFFELRRRGLPKRRASIALAWGQWLQARGFVLLGAASAIAAVAFGELTGRLATIAWIGVAGGGLFLVGTWLLTSHPRPLAAVGAFAVRVLPARAHPEQVREAVLRFHREAHDLLGRGARRHVSWLFLTVGPFAMGVSLWAILEAAGRPISIEEALLAAALTIVASWVPLVPGGIGVAESALTLVLHHFGVPLADGLAVALVWRGITLVGPAATGVVALAGLRFRRVHHPVPTT
ncbi:MAG TPA: lysylphosphatidylglycerol synthase transmembrane domain-containing protein [Acidimicrobiales bacterium]|nr:lysylphosphatidylglycerol synthase transmembrane domain-containing protein [Acidimicrobiales bacterium]